MTSKLRNEVNKKTSTQNAILAHSRLMLIYGAKSITNRRITTSVAIKASYLSEAD